MGNFDLDFTLVQKALYKDNTKIPVKGNEHRMVRIAFDLFRLKGDEKEDLWQIQADDDGEFLVRTYSLPEEEEGQLTASDWTVKQDEKQANLTIAYKGIPIQRLASKDFGANTPEDTMVLRSIVLKKLAQDKKFIFNFFETLAEEKKNILKSAGFLHDLKKWLMSQDITDDIIEKVMNAVEKEGRPFKNECPLEKKQDAKDYEKYFKEKAKEFGAPSGNPQNISEDNRKEFFEEVDQGWKAENECQEECLTEGCYDQNKPLDLAALELELQLKGSREFFYDSSTSVPGAIKTQIHKTLYDPKAKGPGQTPKTVDQIEKYMRNKYEKETDDVLVTTKEAMEMLQDPYQFKDRISLIDALLNKYKKQPFKTDGGNAFIWLLQDIINVNDTRLGKEGIPLELDPDLAALELQLKTAVELPNLPPELRFDISDVEEPEKIEESEEMEIEPAGSFFIDKEKIDELIKNLENLNPKAKK